MDECALRSGLAELEQLRMERISEQVLDTLTPQLHSTLQCEQVEPSGLAVLEQLHVELNSEHGGHVPHSNSLSIHFEIMPKFQFSAFDSKCSDELVNTGQYITW